MKLKSQTEDFKLRGAYYTPYDLAEAIVGKFIDWNDINTILEPSCGDGVFIDAVLSNKNIKHAEITSIEIEDSEVDKLALKFGTNPNIHIFKADFFKYFEEREAQKFDVILGNPPYIRYQYLTPLQRDEMSAILRSEGMTPNKLINSWVGFVVACTTLLKDNGQLAFVLPAELLQVVYAKELRDFLASRYDQLTVITFSEKIFTDIEQEIVVLVAKKKKEPFGIRVIEIGEVKNIKKIVSDEHPFIESTNAPGKWTQYFVTAQEMQAFATIKSDNRFRKMSDSALINVGVTTGNNSFFSISKDTMTKYQLDGFCQPLIGKSSHVHGIYYTKLDAEFNEKKGKKSFLVCYPDMEKSGMNEKSLEYIEYGEKNEVNNGYKCTIRDRWYVLPSIWIPDAFFLRRNNLYPKFVLNSFNAISTDTMHRIKFHEGVNHDTLLLSYYNSISFAFTEINGRSYGGGVLEILPSEVGEIYVPDISNLEQSIISETLQKVDTIIRNNENIEDALDLVDKVVLIDYLNFEKKECIMFRQIWKKLQQRRLKRAKKHTKECKTHEQITVDKTTA